MEKSFDSEDKDYQKMIEVVVVDADHSPSADENETAPQVAPQETAEESTLTDCFSHLTKIQALQEQAAASLCEIEKSVSEFACKDRINSNLHDELQKYKSGLRMEFVSPLLKSIIREYDRATQQYAFYLQKSQAEPQSELFVKLLKEFNFTALSLLDILDDYNYVPFEVQEDEEYNTREHKITKVIETDDAASDRKIAKCLACGFCDSESGRLIRQAEVTIYKLKK
jgi:molecular chaperone GrpE (heat shock protein)